MTHPRPFQKATIEAALRCLRDRKGARRFLVADEVGLGKTVVAQGIIRELIKDKEGVGGGPLVVFYVCSNLAIAAQNRDKLLKVVPSARRDDAVCPVDRLTLVGTKNPPNHPLLHLYTLTPDTSIPNRARRSRRGQQNERALVFALIKYRFPRILKIFHQEHFRSKPWISAEKDEIWHKLVHSYKQIVRENAVLRREFFAALRDELKRSAGQWLEPAITIFKEDPLEIIGRLRSALAAANLNKIRPDLVIFDEFQRFRDLVQEHEPDTSEPSISKAAQSRVASLLRGELTENPPALLLLSATPYKPYARRWEDVDGEVHRREFLGLIRFLYGHSEEAQRKKRHCAAAFRIMESELRLGRLDTAEFKRAKTNVEGILRPVMSRTERFGIPNAGESHRPPPHSSDLHVRDLRVFKHLARSFRNEDRAWAVPFWSSIPLPAQTMGPSYLAWKRRQPDETAQSPAITKEDRDRFTCPSEWPHPRLRALNQIISPEKLVLPWIAPSLPWWQLGGRWKPSNTEIAASGKLLVFSRFRAVPQAIAALVSFGLECRFMKNGQTDYESTTKRSVLQARPKREALVALFHPSPPIINGTEPLAAAKASEREIRKELANQISSLLSRYGVRISGDSRRPIWRLLAGLESRSGTWGSSYKVWRELATRYSVSDDGEQNSLLGLIERWNEEARSEFTEISAFELQRLADFALSAPGVVLGRALKRHWSGAISDGFTNTLKACWLGLRNYLDQPWFVRALGGGERYYTDSIQRAIFEGNLESVLDEHLWVMSRLYDSNGEMLANDLTDVLRLRSSVLFLHSPRSNAFEERFTIRSHAALPFSETKTTVQMPGEDVAKPLRPDELRKAFNSPFWPHVLATTSIGQEGLDFHCWCKKLVHWDLASDPVSHEQRQGRIQRYAGLGIRQGIARVLSDEVIGKSDATSPWGELACLAEVELADSSGLKPWWVLNGSETENVMLTVATSEQNARYSWLQEQVLLYRLVLGHPNQEDLLELLKRNKGITAEQVRASSLELSAYFRQ